MGTARLRRLVGIGIVGAMIVAGCGGRDDDAEPAEATPAAVASTDAPAASAAVEGTDAPAGSAAVEGTVARSAPDSTAAQAVTPSRGITDTEVKIGISAPLSGNFSAFGALSEGVKAYVNDINAQGGAEMADGKRRQISIVVADDGTEPARALANAQRFVEQDEVFAVMAPVALSVGKAMRDYLNEQEVPLLFAVSGASFASAQFESYPWTIGWNLPHLTEAAILVDYLKANDPDATIAVLVNNNDAGKEYLAALESEIEGTSVTIVGRETAEPTDPSVDSQVTNLAGTEADVFTSLTNPKFVAQSVRRIKELGWEPTQFLTSALNQIESTMRPAGFENAQGMLSVQYLKDPADPELADDPAVVRWKELLQASAPNLNPNDGAAFQGYAVAETLIAALERSQPTRASMMEAVRTFDSVQLDALIDGVTLTTSATDPFPIESAELVRFEGERWVPTGELIDLEGETPLAAAVP